jgi:hypothetical protein
VKATIDYLLGTLCGAIYAGAVAVLLPHTSEIALAGALAIAVAPLALIGAINPTFSAATFTGVLVCKRRRQNPSLKRPGIPVAPE